MAHMNNAGLVLLKRQFLGTLLLVLGLFVVALLAFT